MTDLTKLTAAELDALPAAIEAEKARRAEPDYEAWRPALAEYWKHIGGLRASTPFGQTDKCALRALIAARHLMPPEDDGWIAWDGGECPVAAGTLVALKFRDGSTCVWDSQKYWDWWPMGCYRDIIAYRVVKS
jgi:hypothetical protein